MRQAGLAKTGFDHARGGKMNLDLVQGNLKQFKGKVRVRWSTLIGDQLGVISGTRTQSGIEGHPERPFFCAFFFHLAAQTNPTRPDNEIAIRTTTSLAPS
jgi:hypothetical protein